MAHETWRLLSTWDAPPGFNMALDEALLLGDDPTPVLRLYTWRPDALSLGYFQRHDEVVAELRERVGTLPRLVRRMTGGGAIHHVNELTFSIAAPAAHPLYAGPIAGSYERVHAVLAQALQAHGADARPRDAGTLASDDAKSPMCFHGSVPLDLAWNDRKGVGSAQRRLRRPGPGQGRVLHHGSIKLGTSELEGPIATLGDVTAEEFARSVTDAFERALDVRFDASAPTEDELLAARAREEWFGSEAFLRRK